MSGGFELERIQEWMRCVLVHPEGAAAGVDSADATDCLATDRARLENLLQPSAQMTALERVGIYARMVKDRLVEVLEMDYDGVQRLVGSERFDQLARSFVHRHPSTWRSLNDYGREFPEHLAELRDAIGPAELAAFAIDLARLESVLQDVLLAPDAQTVVDDREFAALAEDPARFRLRTHPALRIESHGHPVHRFLEQSSRTEPFAPEETTLLVHPFGDRVTWLELSPPAEALIRALQRGDSLQSALESALERTQEEAETLLPRVQSWFQEWRGRGLFVGVEPLR